MQVGDGNKEFTIGSLSGKVTFNYIGRMLLSSSNFTRNASTHNTDIGRTPVPWVANTVTLCEQVTIEVLGSYILNYTLVQVI